MIMIILNVLVAFNYKKILDEFVLNAIMTNWIEQ